MSKGTKWFVGILVIVVIAGLAWRSGVLGNNDNSQSASVASSNSGNSAAVDNSDAGLTLNVKAIDTQLQGIQSDLAAASSTTKLIAVAARVQVAAGLMNKLGTALQTRVINSKMTALQAKISDLNIQLQNGTSQAGTAKQNIAKASVTDSGAIAQAQLQLKTAVTNLQAARADIQAVIDGVKGK